MPVFRIGHISDLHFGYPFDRLNPLEAVGSKSGREKARAALAALVKNRKSGLGSVLDPSTFNPDVALGLLHELNKKQESLHAILVTGDLATTGDHADLKLARDYFSGKLPPEWDPIGKQPSLLERSKAIVISLPGNHDRYDGLALIPGSRNYESHFGDFWDFNSGIAYDCAVSNSAYRVRVCALEDEDSADCVLFICMADLSLDYHNQGVGAFGWVGQGSAERAVVDALVETTGITAKHAKASGRKREIATLWAIHFPPVYPQIDQSLELLTPLRLIEAAQDCGVSTILTGHTHQALKYNAAANYVRGTPEVNVICCGASAGRSEHSIYSYSIIEVEICNGIQRIVPHNYVWNAKLRKFDKEPQFPTA